MNDIESKETVKSEPAIWFAMSATFGRELKAREYLESRSVECFVPMRHAMVADRRSGRTRRLVPAVSNLLFARSTRRRLQEVKTGAPYLQYHTIPVEGRNVPIVVPDGEMECFMAVCRTLREELVYLSPDEVDLQKDTPVRIEGGAFTDSSYLVPFTLSVLCVPVFDTLRVMSARIIRGRSPFSPDRPTCTTCS